MNSGKPDFSKLPPSCKFLKFCSGADRNADALPEIST
jgi:hypothetical protein